METGGKVVVCVEESSRTWQRPSCPTPSSPLFPSSVQGALDPDSVDWQCQP